MCFLVIDEVHVEEYVRPSDELLFTVLNILGQINTFKCVESNRVREIIVEIRFSVHSLLTLFLLVLIINHLILATGCAHEEPTFPPKQATNQKNKY